MPSTGELGLTIQSFLPDVVFPVVFPLFVPARLRHGPRPLSGVTHHGRKMPVAEQKTIGMARDLLEIPMPVKLFRTIVQTVKKDGNEGERCACFVTISQGLCHQNPPESVAFVSCCHTEPRQEGDRKDAAT